MRTLIFLMALLPAFSMCGQKKAIQLPENPTSTEVVEAVKKVMDQYYYDAQATERVNKALDRALAENLFDTEDPNELTRLVSRVIHEQKKDLHIQLIYLGNEPLGSIEEQPISKIEHLAGNIGYLKINEFPTDDDATDELLKKTFNYFKNVKGMIIDLQDNGGGSPHIVDLMLSQFVESDQVYDVFHETKRDVSHEYRTNIKRYGNALKGKPLLVLTSHSTGSAGELFAFAVQNLKLGEVWGETTRGMVNLAEFVSLNKDYVMLVSKGYQKSPFQKEGLEARGVIPDKEIHSNILEQAHKNMIEQVWEGHQQKWFISDIDRESHSAEHGTSLKNFTGTYQSVSFFERSGQLFYMNSRGIAYGLKSFSDHEFGMANTNDVVRFDFVEENGTVTKVKVTGVNGSVRSFTKSVEE